METPKFQTQSLYQFSTYNKTTSIKIKINCKTMEDVSQHSGDRVMQISLSSRAAWSKK